MKQTEWDQIMKDLHNTSNPSVAAKAFIALKQKADRHDLPKLYQMIKSADFYEREAAAYPLGRLEKEKALPILLETIIQAVKEDEDTDSIEIAIADVISANPDQAKKELSKLAKSSNPDLKKTAQQWLEAEVN